MQELDINNAMAQVRELRAIADMLVKSTKLQEARDRLTAGWEGQAAKEFSNKCHDIDVLLKNEVANIKDIANRLEIISKEIADADKKTSEAIKP